RTRWPAAHSRGRLRLSAFPCRRTCAQAGRPSRETAARVGEKQVDAPGVRYELAGEQPGTALLAFRLAQRLLELVEVAVHHVLEGRVGPVAAADLVKCCPALVRIDAAHHDPRSEEHTSELQS